MICCCQYTGKTFAWKEALNPLNTTASVRKQLKPPHLYSFNFMIVYSEGLMLVQKPIFHYHWKIRTDTYAFHAPRLFCHCFPSPAPEIIVQWKLSQSEDSSCSLKSSVHRSQSLHPLKGLYTDLMASKSHYSSFSLDFLVTKGPQDGTARDITCDFPLCQVQERLATTKAPL